MPNEMYNEYQSLAGNTDPAAMQRRRELARALQMQRRGTIPPGAVTAEDIAQKQRGMAQPQMTPPVPVQPPAFAGNRMGQPNEAAIQGFNPAQNYAGNRMGQPDQLDMAQKEQFAKNQAMIDAKEQAFRANLGQVDQGMQPAAPMPGTPSNMPSRPSNFPGNRLPVAPMRPGNRLGQVNEAGLRAFNPDTQFKIDQILSRFPRR